MMKNWQTTISTLPAAFGAAVNIYTALSHGATPEANQWGIVGVAVSAVLIGLFSKDRNVTGGTKPQTAEAVMRAQSAPLN